MSSVRHLLVKEKKEPPFPPFNKESGIIEIMQVIA